MRLRPRHVAVALAVVIGGASAWVVGVDDPAVSAGPTEAQATVSHPQSSSTTTTRPAIPATPATRWVSRDVTLTYGGIPRSYLVISPAAAGPAATLPVVMVLHGRAVSPSFEEQRTGFTKVVGPAILVYPAGYQQSWNAGNCCAAAMAAGVDDVGFLTTVLHQVLASGPGADPTRVYLVGYSNGGKMALTLACADPSAFAGVGVYGATAAAPCPTVGAVSLIEVASTGDPEVTIGPAGTPKTAGTFVQPTVTGEVARYRGADGCTATSSTAGAGSFTQTTWASCSGGRKVALGRYQGGSHSWPAGGGATPSGAQVLWSFFRSLGA